jgi:hypothetical protein
MSQTTQEAENSFSKQDYAKTAELLSAVIEV